MRSTLAYLPLALALALTLGAPAALALAAARPEPGRPAVLVVPPWERAAERAAAAGARVLLPGRVAAVALVAARDPAFPARLAQAGPAILFAADLSSYLCSPP